MQTHTHTHTHTHTLTHTLTLTHTHTHTHLILHILEQAAHHGSQVNDMSRFVLIKHTLRLLVITQIRLFGGEENILPSGRGGEEAVFIEDCFNCLSNEAAAACDEDHLWGEGGERESCCDERDFFSF